MVSRREFLTGIALTYATISENSAYTRTRNNGYDHFNLFGGYSGVPDYFFEDEDFRQKMEQDFNRYRPEKLEKDGLNLIVDFRRFDGAEPDQFFYDGLEGFFSAGGINTMCMEYGEKLDSDEIENQEQVTDIFGEPSVEGLLDPESAYSEIDPLYQDMAVQVFLVPWELTGPQGADKFSGLAVGTRAAMEFGFDLETEFHVAKHEIGHCLGLEHSDNPDNLMHPNSDYGSLSSEQWEYIRDQLS